MEVAILWWAVVQRVFRTPATWLLVAASLGLVPFLARFSPLLASDPDELGARWILEWALPIGLIAILLGQMALTELNVLTLRLSAPSRCAARLGGYLVPIWALQAPLLVGAIASGLELRSLFPLVGRMLCADLHLAALALLVHGAASGATARSVLFLGIAWLLPAFLAEGGTVMELVASWVDAGRFLRSPVLDFHSLHAWAALGPPIGLFGASLLFRTVRV